MKLNREESLSGGLIGLAFIFYLKWWVILTIPACLILWAMGGADNIKKIWRRLGVPVVLCGALAIALKSWIPLCSIPALFVVLSMGYGIPNKLSGDNGSALGRWVYWNLAERNEEKATFYTRGIIGSLMGVAMFPLVEFDIGGWLFGTMLLAIGYPYIVEAVE